MKPAFAILFLFQSIFCFSQTKEITKILNRELKKEIRFLKEYPDLHYGIKFDSAEDFKIRDSIFTAVAIVANPPNYEPIEDKKVQTEMKILSITVKKKKLYEDGFYIEKQEVELGKIKAIIKDINIIFETENDDVTVTTTEENGEKSVRKGDMFFLHLSGEQQNEYLADEIIRAFKKAGYEIEKRVWAD